MTTTYNFSNKLEGDKGWYDGFEPHKVDLSSLKRKSMLQLRARAWTLHQYQTFSQDVVCGLMFWCAGREKPTHIHSRPDAQLNFFISGGVEIPHLGLNLRLRYKDDPTSKKDQYLKLAIIWTVWDGSDLHQREITTTPERASGPGTEDHTFSARLRQVSLTPISLTEAQASSCQGNAGADGYQARWASKVVPYVYGFDVAKSSLEWFNEAQKKSIELFINAAYGDRFKLYTRVRAAALCENWNTLKSMPRLTYPPFPLYDCRWHIQAKRFERMEEIPDIDDLRVQIHHRRRERQWSHITAKGHCFTDKFEIPGLDADKHITFINEREYQAIRSIGLLREVAANERRYDHQFNRDYTFDMIPASEVESTATSSSTETYYVAFEIQLQQGDSDAEQTLQLPDVGTPVRVTPKGRDTKQSNKPIWPWPKPKLAKSSGAQPSASGERTSVVGMSRKPQQSYSSGGSSSQHTAVARQDQSSLGKSHFGKASTAPIWHGYVVSSSLADIKSLGAPTNLVFAKIHKPHDEMSRGRVLNMTARVTFGQPNVPRVAARKAIQNVMWGNEGLGIPTSSKMKVLLLAHENHVMKFLPPDNENLDDTRIPSFLSWLKDSRNPLQKRAIREALSPHGGFMKLITGPPGTGKTAVSTAIIRYCYVTETPILVICGQNQGLDVVAQRYSSLYENDNADISQVYRLGTEFAESVDMHFKEDQELTTHRVSGLRENFKRAVHELSRADIAERIVGSLEASLTGMGVNLQHLSLGRFIMSRVKNEIRLQGSPGRETNQESELLMEFACWQQVIRMMEKLQVEPIDRTSTSAHIFSAEQRELQAGFQKLWGKLQKFYLKKARVVFCTADTAGRHILRGFRPRFVLIEEASHISETTCLVPIMANYIGLKRVILSGDTAQLPPTVISRDENECGQIEQVSLFERMILSGHPDIQLQTQYRMMAGICKFVSTEFYNGTLETVESAPNRATSKTLSNFMSTRYKCSPGSSFFLSLSGTTVVRRQGGTSILNPEYVSHIADLVDALAKKVPNLPQEDILVLSYYNEERRVLSELLRKLGHSKVRVKSVDSSQGSESPVVILSTTRPGGQWGLGFITDRKRSCVALSRAQSCLIVVGFEKMGMATQVGSGQGFQVWERLVKQHEQTSTLCRVKGSSALLKQQLGISEGSSGYERALR
ncbi:hypothetical protein AAEP93_005923 [Penicillium crustosum]